MANQKSFLATKSPIRSQQLRSIYLHDWWLIKVEADYSNGSRLGVGGFSFTEKLGIRVFCSSAITKRHDHVTLETDDGITITLSGLINRSHTQEKGFPREVCSYFLHGFPYNWKQYADQSCEKSIKNIFANDGARSTLPLSFDDLPVTRVRDLLMTTTRPDYCAITETIFNDILGMCGDDPSSSHFEPSVEENAYQETPRKREKNKTEQKRKDDGSISFMTEKKRKDAPPKTHNQSKVGVEIEGLNSNTRVATRSMTRARNLKKNEFENHPPITFMKCNLSISVPVSNGSSADNNGALSEKPSEPIRARSGAPSKREPARNTRRSNRLKCTNGSSVTGQETKDN